MIRFRLFGVSVSIHPSLWFTLAMVGLMMVSGVSLLPGVVLFTVAGFLCLFVHEMGHALVSRALGGGQPEIFMAWLGGDCCNDRAVLTRWRGVVMTAAGPLASLLLAILCILLLSLYVGGLDSGLYLTLNFLFGYVPSEYVALFPSYGLAFFKFIIQITVWWSLLNLLPIFPLDGGQIMHGLMRSPHTMHVVSVTVAAMSMTAFIAMGAWFLVLLMGFLCYFNFRCLQHSPY